jgi:APA family basic amino acid/polyamine antiporter
VTSTDADPGTLRRSVSLPWLVLYGLGTTVGAGIYALTGVVAGRAGMYAPAAFVLAAVLAFFTALSFAELSSRFPRAGGEAVYVLEGFGWRWLASTVGLLVVLAGLISAATVSVALVGYLSALFPVSRFVVIPGVVLAIGGVATYGVRESVTAAGVMTVIEVGGLLAVIGFGLHHFGTLPERAIEFVPASVEAWQLVGATTILCFYAFLGFEDMVNVAEEVRDVRRILPRAILLTLGITAVLYALVTTVAVLAVPPEELGASEAPLSLVFARCGGSPETLGVVAIFALLNGALIQIIKASRVLYGLAREGVLPGALGRVHPRTRTPALATALVTALTLIFALTFPLAALAEATAVITLVTFTAANLALLLVKRRQPIATGATRVPAWVPAVGFAVSFGFVVLELVQRLL